MPGIVLVVAALALHQPVSSAADAPSQPTEAPPVRGKLPEREAARLLARLHLPDLPADHLRNVEVVRDLVYHRDGDAALKLDLYLPGGTDEPRPAIVVIRGGGFLAGDKEGFAPMAAHLAASGYVAACIAYRGIPDDPYAATVADVRAAVRYLRTHAPTYAIDPQRIGAIGQSAGGHLALTLAVSPPEVDSGKADAEPSSRVQAAVSWSGVFDLVERFAGDAAQPLEKKQHRIARWIGEPYAADSAAWRAASPFYQVSAETAPALFVCCTGDPVVPSPQSVRMHEALKQHGVPTQLLVLDADVHGILQSEKVCGQAWAATLTFFKEQLAAE